LQSTIESGHDEFKTQDNRHSKTAQNS